MAQTQIDVASRLAAQTARYLMSVRKVMLTTPRPDPGKAAEAAGLDPETFVRWGRYLSAPQKIEHPFLKPWFTLLAAGGGSDTEAKRLAEDFQKLVLDVIAEKIAIRAANERSAKSYLPDPDEPRAALPGDLVQFERFQYKQKLVEKVMEPHRFYVWLDVVQGEQASQDYEKKDGICEYDFKRAVRFYTPEQKSKLNTMLADLKSLEKDLPPEYPYVMGIAETAPADLKLNMRGNPHLLGDTVPRALPGILGGTAIRSGSGRLELAEAIVRHPLAARVIANRVWMHHFGRGIVATPSNFGAGGDRPTHPELLDYLASRLVENGWSIKALHREILLSATYQLSAQSAGDADPDNRWFARANVRRLDVESLRDSLLSAAGTLDETLGGPPQELSSPETTGGPSMRASAARSTSATPEPAGSTACSSSSISPTRPPAWTTGPTPMSLCRASFFSTAISSCEPPNGLHPASLRPRRTTQPESRKHTRSSSAGLRDPRKYN